MQIRLHIAAVLALMLNIFLSPVAGAQIRIPRIGILNSPKALGITVQTLENQSDAFNTFSLMADMDGIFTGEAKDPGARMCWIHGEPILKGVGDGFDYTFYAGAGASFGFVRDFGSTIHRNHGLTLAMASVAGVMLEFPGHIDLAIDFSAELGLHLRKDETYPDRTDLSWYANGILNCWMPQITLFYRF